MCYCVALSTLEAQRRINYYSVHSSMALQPSVRPWPLLQFRNLFYTDGRTPWTSDQSVARPQPTHRTTQNRIKAHTHRHPCFEWDSNPRTQRSSERRQFIPHTARPLWSALVTTPYIDTLRLARYTKVTYTRLVGTYTLMGHIKIKTITAPRRCS
jgi:hypothetical protein